ncbi:glycosyltransferase family 4 protein [Achromobacter sp. GG226]|uniref:glycosyltransferase family 4 protein n=1 Tax=Verticiella alkaliphila TaxID=2779529 RepID=UPI001C0B4FB6|nr:glycosyltransferase family 1 protein [Verticiella sp. GG226]MBU4609931.1 glycosyltransferase family 4 protein [Verticiella sp. GG226]
MRRIVGGLMRGVRRWPWAKRLAAGLMARFPGLGLRVMRLTAPAPARLAPAGPVDVAAQAVYVAGGFAPLLDGQPAPHPAPTRQWLVDVTGLVERDAHTGIQRVVRNLLRAFVLLRVPGWRVEPIYADAQGFRYARAFAQREWGLPNLGLPDAPVQAQAGDVFFTADVALLSIAHMQPHLQAWRARGIPLHFVVHDLIPLLQPEYCLGKPDPRFARWMQIVADTADGLWCVSAAVAQQTRDWLAARGGAQPPVGWFHSGVELPREAAAQADASAITLSARGPDTTVFLMVGTIEARKGHPQALDACERLWAAGEDVALIVLGRVAPGQGALGERLRRHAQRGQRLCLLEGASDAVLVQAYATADALLAASYAEGFGLPLIEAAQQGIPIIARDLPVFREVAGEHAYYVDADDADGMADALRIWIALSKVGSAPTSHDMPYLSWSQSAARLAQQFLPAGAGERS